MAGVSEYEGSALGALEECQRCCLEERQVNIYYYIGKAY